VYQRKKVASKELLALLRATGTTLTGLNGIARQKVNYHLEALEAHVLVELSEERRHGGITERVLQASAV